MNRTAKVRQRYRAEGKCQFCPSEVVEGQSLCAKHAEYNRARARARRASQRVVSTAPDAELVARLEPRARAIYLAELAKPPAERWT